MSIDELIGFFISLLALVFIFFKQQFQNRQRQEHADEFKEDESRDEDPLKELMMAMEKESAQKENVQRLPPPFSAKREKHSKEQVLPSLEEYRLISGIEKRQLKSSLESRHLGSKIVKQREDIVSVSSKRSHAIHMENNKSIEHSRIQKAINRLSHQRDLIIYKEIVDKPRSLRPYL